MRMNQDERRFDFHGLGAALKRAREEKGWTQAYVAELVDRDSRTIMNIENKGQYPVLLLHIAPSISAGHGRNWIEQKSTADRFL